MPSRWKCFSGAGECRLAGVTDTPSWSGLGEGRERFFAEVASRLPAKRVGKPEDVAAVILAVATNRFSSGAVFHVEAAGGSAERLLERDREPTRRGLDLEVMP